MSVACFTVGTCVCGFAMPSHLPLYTSSCETVAAVKLIVGLGFKV